MPGSPSPLSWLDWAIVAVVVAIPFVAALVSSRRAGRGLTQFFLSGRDLPWWLAGTSMVATTFAADTPLAVTGIVATSGISGNWIWWSAGLGSMLTVAFFARLWRRAGILTDVEFAELRYQGRAAAWLRGVRGLYLGLPINCLIIGWVNLAMSTILSVTLGWDRLTGVFVGLVATGVYATLGGLRGVVMSDLLQFGLAMVGSVVLAVLALSHPAVGGVAGLQATLPAPTFDLLPRFDTPAAGLEAATLPLAAFLAYLGVQWWASWYPGQEPGGGGYVAQRIMAARSEVDATRAALWFAVAHYCVRPWPWILVALASLVLYPDLSAPETGYALVMRDLLPVGWRGLLVGAFFAAYMSTVSTQLNWGSSLLVNDVYRRFVRPEASERELVAVSRATTVALMILGGAVTFVLDSVRQAWEFALESGAGVGLVMILRWYWWRVSAVSEITAVIAAAAGFLVLRTFTEVAFPQSLLYLVPGTTVCWLVATWLTAPEPMPHLEAFYRRVRPGGPGWGAVARRCDLTPTGLGPLLRQWLAGVVLVYGALAFGAGLLFGNGVTAWVAGLAAAAGGASLWWELRDPAPG